MIAATARFLVAQRLVKRLCPHCRKPHRDSGALAERYGRVVGIAAASGIACAPDRQTQGFFEAGGGCRGCNRSGFVGRIGIFEFRDIRRGGRSAPAPEDTLRPLGSRGDLLARRASDGDIGARCMREDGILKASFGITTPDDVFGATMDASRVRLTFRNP